VLELAKEAQQAAFRAIECDRQDDIAHHLLGRFNYGMASLNIIVRQLIKVVFGSDFRSGTMDDALNYYQNAAALRPDRVIHRVELGRLFVNFGQYEDAIRELEVRP
jgi:tetratricopeptide (TPR) repeat protein